MGKEKYCLIQLPAVEVGQGNVGIVLPLVLAADYLNKAPVQLLKTSV